MALTRPFAQNGDKLAIPDTASDSSVSYNLGFTYAYALPPEEGGKFIDRAQFNQLMYDTTSQVITNKNNITTIQGDVATAKVNITALQRDVNALESDVSNIESTISQVISSNVAPIGVYKTVNNKTIGTNGDFKTIQEAFAYVQTHQKQGLHQNLTLTLLEDLSGDLFFRGAWYPYLTINCNGFVLADKLTIDLSCFLINNLKLNDRLLTGVSILWITGNSIDINYQSEDFPAGCITALSNSYINLGGVTMNFATTPNRAGIASKGNSMVYLAGATAITQTTGANCFNVSNGGIIQLNGGLNLTGVTVPKANIAANTITNSGLIIGNYYSI